MNKKLKDIWNDPVWSKVISAGIIALLVAAYGIAAKYFSWWPFTGLIENITTFLTNNIATPVWLFILLSVPVIVLIVVCTKRYFSKTEPLTEFFTIPEVARELKVSDEKIYQWGMTGKIIFAFIRYEPSDYEEVRHEKDELGREVMITRITTTMLSLSSKKRPPVDIAYLQPEDTARIVLNKAENRSILIHKLFETNELLPKKGKLLVNCPVSVKKEDLIITRDELSRFRKKYGPILKQEK